MSNKKFAARVRDVLKELFASRYHLCCHPDSNGLRDAAYDLLPYKVLNVYDKLTAARTLRHARDKESI